MTDPIVTVHPGMRWGQPSVCGISVAAIAGTVWAEGCWEAASGEYDLGREHVLVACWYAGRYGVGESARGDAHWRRRWGTWAYCAAAYIAAGRWHEIDDPPGLDE